MLGLTLRLLFSGLLALIMADRLSGALSICEKLEEDLPGEVYRYALSMREDLKILGMVLDEQLPFGHSYDAETVLTKARDLLAGNGWKEGSRQYFEALGGAKQTGQPMAGAMYFFHSLRDCLYECNYASSLVLAANYVALFENELYAADDDRVKWTVLRVAELHAEKCLPRYSDQVQRLIETIEPGLMEKLNILLDQDLLDKLLVGRNIRNVSSIDVNDQLLQARSHLFDRVAILAKGTREEKYITAKRNGFGRLDYEVNPEFKSRTVAQHVIEPCRKFVRHFRDLFYSLRLDDILMDGSENIEQTQGSLSSTDQHPELMNLWTKYRVCRELSIDRIRFADLIAGELPQKLGLISHEIQTPTANETKNNT